MKRRLLNGVPAGSLNRSGLEQLDETTLRLYARHYALFGELDEDEYFDLLQNMLEIYTHRSSSELIDLFNQTESFPPYPWFHINDLPSFLNFSAHYFSLQHGAKAARLPNIPIFAYPKTGSSFIATTFANALNIPFGTISVDGLNAVPAWARCFANGPGVLHDHLWIDEEGTVKLKSFKFRKIIVHIRDPRQVMISLAHHAKSAPFSAEFSGGLRAQDVINHSVEQIIDRLINESNFIENYGNWLNAWLDTHQDFDLFISRYEKMNADPKNFFRDILKFCDSDKATIEKLHTYLNEQKNAKADGKFNFRNGRAEEWKDILTEPQKSNVKRQLDNTILGKLYPA